MAEKRSSGCLGIFLVVALIGGGMIAVILFMFLTKARGVAHAEQVGLRMEAQADHKVVFQGDQFPAMPGLEPGAVITREQFVTHTMDSDATELSKSTFRKIADQATVTWLLQTVDISEKDGKIVGQFQLPWEIREGRSSHGSSLSLRCEFSEHNRGSLIHLRRGDWIKVTGTLTFNGSTAVIKEASVPASGTILPAEHP